MKLSPSAIFSLMKEAFIGWQHDNATVWCASLAYFTVFSLGPLFLIAISIIGLIFNKSSIETKIYFEMQNVVGSGGANMLQTVIHHAHKPTSGIIGTIVGAITLLVGAAGMFGQLEQMLNFIWGVEQKPKAGIGNLIRDRLLNFSMVGVIAFLLLVSLIASTAISGLGSFIGRYLPISPILLEITNIVISLILITVLFAFIFRVLPDVRIRWKNTWIGALITSLLFTIGKSVIGIYIGHSGLSSEYGSAASLIVLLLWVYYSTQILFFGAEFTKAYTLKSGEKITPSQYSILTPKGISESKKNERSPGAKTAAKIGRGLTEGIIDKTIQINQKKKKKRS